MSRLTLNQSNVNIIENELILSVSQRTRKSRSLETNIWDKH